MLIAHQLTFSGSDSAAQDGGGDIGNDEIKKVTKYLKEGPPGPPGDPSFLSEAKAFSKMIFTAMDATNDGQSPRRSHATHFLPLHVCILQIF